MQFSASSPHVAVVGAGSVGLLFAATFSQEFPVTLVTRRDAVRSAVAASGIVVSRPDGTQIIAPAGRVECAAAPADPFDLVIVACRSGDSTYALATAQELAGATGRILIVQNGLRAWDMAREQHIRCVCGATYEVVHPLAPNAVAWTRVGRTEIAAPQSVVDDLQTFFTAASLHLVVAESEADVIWRKVVLTLPNWIAAAIAAPLHSVVESEHGLLLLAPLVAELASAAYEDGVVLSVTEAMAQFAALRGTGSVGSAYTALMAGQELEVIDIFGSVMTRAASMPHAETLMRLASLQMASRRTLA